MNVYALLLRRMGERTRATENLPLEQAVVAKLAESEGVQLLDFIECAGIFNAVLVCRAPDNATIAALLYGLVGWHTDALLATSHVRYESALGTSRLQ